MNDEKKLENYAETAVKVVGTLTEKTVVPIYEDLAKPSLKQIGEGLGGFLSIAMMPLQMMGYQAEHWKNEFQKSLDRKASKIPIENLQVPDPIIVGPIMQALGYTVHKEPLREMFTSLLATAMDSQEEYKAHPAFVEMIKQIDSDEAKIIQGLSKYAYSRVLMLVSVKGFPKASFSIVINKSNLSYVSPNLSNYENENKYIDNLKRLEIINVEDMDINPNDEDWQHYLKLQNRCLKDYNEIKNDKDFMAGIPDGFEYTFAYQSIRSTEFGLAFINACVRSND